VIPQFQQLPIDGMQNLIQLLFNVGAVGETNGSGTSQVAYVFVEKKGYSKFGSYTGNGSADGTFVYTGMKPAFVLSKKHK
jgi:hypothetical protein